MNPLRVLGCYALFVASWWLVTTDRWKRPLAAWLRCPIWPTNEWSAAILPWQYGRLPDGRYWTSPLGVVNGLLPRFGALYLVTHHREGTRDTESWPEANSLEPPYLSFRRLAA